jgi:hypothetical protein
VGPQIDRFLVVGHRAEGKVSTQRLQSPQFELAVFATKIQNDWAYILGKLSGLSILMTLGTSVDTQASENLIFINYSLL